MDDAASWMRDQVLADGCLYQFRAVAGIEEFGTDLAYFNDHGNPAIDKRVLAAFRKLTESTVVWERGQKCWRLRDARDDSGRSTY